jgi:hypothetical protein
MLGIGLTPLIQCTFLNSFVKYNDANTTQYQPGPYKQKEIRYSIENYFLIYGICLM